MGHKRFFVQEISPITTLSGEEYNHAVNTLRVRVGEEIILLNNTEKEYVAQVISIDKKTLSAKIIEEHQNDKECQNEITLICGYLKGDKTELVVQKAVELGVKRIAVFDSRYGSAYISDNKLARLNKVSIESSKQCGRSYAPKVVYFDNFQDAIIYGNSSKNKLFACEFMTNETQNLSVLQGSTSIVVGSEGGFTEEEAQFASQNGYKTITLGKRILRAETASIATVAIIAFLLGEMS